MGARRFLTRFWPLMAGARRNIGASELRASAASDTGDAATVKLFRESLHASLEWWLAGLAPRARSNRPGSWGAYRNERSHYKEEALSSKRTWISQWLADLKPEWVVDLGCNSGEFSFMAVEAGANVVAIDSDHDSVEAMFRVAGATGRLYPVLATLDDLNGARGWGGAEFRGLSERMAARFDLVLMLALIHHLAVAASVPLEAIAAFARGCTRRWLIIEFIDPTDPQMQLLCTRHQRNAEEFSVDRQRDAFLSAGFDLQAQVRTESDTRVLSLLELRA
jgi:SAM-dependent methyltransferase